MSFSEYKERISEGDTVIIFLVSIIHCNNQIVSCNFLLNCVLNFLARAVLHYHVHFGKNFMNSQ